MGNKWWIRTSEVRNFPLETVDYTDYRINSFWEYIKLRVAKRGKIIFIQRSYY